MVLALGDATDQGFKKQIEQLKFEIKRKEKERKAMLEKEPFICG